MSVAPGLAIDAAGDADTNLESDNFMLNPLSLRKTDERKGVFGGIYQSEQNPPVAKTFFGQNHIPDISELGLRLDNADTLSEQKSLLSASSLAGASGINGAKLINQSQDKTAKAESEVEVIVPQCPRYSHQELLSRLEPRNGWEKYNVHRTEQFGLRRSGASIRSANSSDEAACSDYGTREEPVVTTYSDELDSPKLTAGRSGDNCVAFEAEEIYDAYTEAFQHEADYQKNQGTHDTKTVEDLSPEQFRRQLDNYMESDTTDHIRYSPSSSSNESNIHSSASSAANLYDGFVPLNKHRVNDQESDNDDEVDDDDETVDVEDVLQHEKGPKFVSLPRREYIHPLLRSYNDLRGGTPVGGTPVGGTPVGAPRGGAKTDQGHGDRGDAYQKLYPNSSSDSCKKKSERTRPSVYNRLRKFFRTFLRKKSSESTQTEPGPLPII